MINWQEEIVKPYNDRYGTEHTSAGSLIAELRYGQKKTWAAIDKILCTDMNTIKNKFEKSPFYDPGKRLRPGTLKDKLMAIPPKELKNLGIREIMERVPGYAIGSYHDVLRENKLMYKKKGVNSLKKKLLAIHKKQLKKLTIEEIRKRFPGYSSRFYNQVLRGNGLIFRKRKQ